MRPKNIKLSLKQVFSIKLMYVSEAANDLAPLVWGHFHHLAGMNVHRQCGKCTESCVVSGKSPGKYYNGRYVCFRCV